ncbi:hypothetical protein [Streptomyces sp. NPDC005322]|uniref:hypothetical protein n=1 Tax=Streptomyces sp. NPDC005322 TaxID=3157032 RepID=UPI0033A51919
MTSRICYRCQLPTDEPIPVLTEHTGSVAGATIFACPAHAADYPQHSRPSDLTAAFRTRPQEQP